MKKSKSNVRLGEGVADNTKLAINKEILEIGILLVDIVSKNIKGKIQEIHFDELFGKKNKEELVELWSRQLAEKGLIPQGYIGLSDELLIDNMHQTGYLDGIYVGYILAMMSLVDNEASKDLILSVREDIFSNLMNHHYNNNRDEFIHSYKNEKYDWVNKVTKGK